MENFYVLGIESSANKIGVGILKNGTEIVANERATYNPPPGQGVIPVEAAEHHRANIFGLVDAALAKAKISICQIDLYAYTKGPGMHQLLAVGCTVARTLSLLHNKPLVPVNHCVAHIEMGKYVTGSANPVVLYASGGNTQIISRVGMKYKIFGETLDVAVGNCLDKVARAMNLPNDPSPGYNIEIKAREGKNYVRLPYNMKGMDMSFSGILSTVLRRIDEGYNAADLCYSLQETIFAILTEATERCMAFVESKDVLVVGGVGCNVRLQEMVGKMVEQRGGKLHATDERYCIDNGIMIAYTGYMKYKSEPAYITNYAECYVTQRYRTDKDDITW